MRDDTCSRVGTRWLARFWRPSASWQLRLGRKTAGTACVTPGALVPPTNSLGDFYSNFVANGKLATYGIPLNPATGQNDAGDRNSTYFPLYYSNTNLQSWMRSNLQSPGAGAQVGGLP
jgi:hypothetical protein